MKRYGYLWGTGEKGYCELGRAPQLDSFLRNNLNAVNPTLALAKAKNMLSGFTALPDYAEQGGNALAVRYAPLYINKKVPALSGMNPFCTVCVNGMEKTVQGGRESYYTYLTFLTQEEILGNDDYNYLDQIFGTKLYSAAEIEDYKKGRILIDFTAAPVKVKPLLNQKDMKAVFLAVAAMYQGTDWRVILKIEPQADFLNRAFALLKQIYSLLPARMAMETGFSIYEDPRRIKNMSKEINTRIFVLSAGCEVNKEKDIPEHTILMDLKEGVPAFKDQSFSNAMIQWCKLDWEVRCQSMGIYLDSKTEYFKRSYYIAATEQFIRDVEEFVKWENTPEEIISSDGSLSRQIEIIRDIHEMYLNLQVCRVSFYRDRFIAKVKKILPKGNSLKNLRTAAIRNLIEKPVPEIQQESMGWYQWLSELDHDEIALNVAEGVFKDENARGEARKQESIKQEVEKWQSTVTKLKEELSESAQRQEEAVKTETKKWQDTVDKLREELDTSVKRQESAVAAETKKWQSTVDKLQEELNSSTQRQEVAVKAEIQKWQAELQRQNREFDEERCMMRSNISNLEIELDGERNKRDESEKTVIELRTRISKLEKNLNEVNRYSDIPKERIRKELTETKEKLKETQKRYAGFKRQAEKDRIKMWCIFSGAAIVILILGLIIGVLIGKGQNKPAEDTVVEKTNDTGDNEEIQPLKIVLQPVEATVDIGSNVTFKASANSDDVTYQWREKNVEGQTEEIPEGTSEMLLVTASEENNGSEFFCVITATDGQEVISDSAVLNVNIPEKEAKFNWEAVKNSVAEYSAYFSSENTEEYVPENLFENYNALAVLATGNEMNEESYVLIAEKRDVSSAEISEEEYEKVASYLVVAVEQYPDRENEMLTIKTLNALKQQSEEEINALIDLGEGNNINLTELFELAGIENWWQEVSEISTDKEENDSLNSEILNENGDSPSTIPSEVYTIGQTYCLFYIYPDESAPQALKENWNSYHVVTSLSNSNVSMLLLPMQKE